MSDRIQTKDHCEKLSSFALLLAFAALFLASAAASAFAQVPIPRPTERPRPTPKPRPTARPTPAPKEDGTVKPQAWKGGDKVFVKWADSYWYPARVLEKSGSKYKVQYDFDRIQTVIEPKFIYGDHVTPWTKVEGNFKEGGKFYPGTITFRNGESVGIKYDDGDTETTTIGQLRLAYKNLPAPRKFYELKVCNKRDEKIWFTLTFATVTNYASEGWWWVGANKCFDIELTPRMEVAGVPANFRNPPPVLIYGETEGILGGAIKETFEGEDSRLAFCINEDRSKSFRNYKWREEGTRAIDIPCSGSGQELVNMQNIKPPENGTLYRWVF